MFKILALIALGIIVVLIGPFLTIWAFNTLFPAAAVPFNLATWFAVVVLGAFFRAKVSIKK